MSAPTPTAESLHGYVQAAAALAGIPMDGERAGRVAMHLARTAALAALLESVPLAPDDEPVALYDPALPPAAKP